MTNDDKIEIEKIQKKLEQLSQKQVELSRAHQQRVKSHEEQKTLYQHLLGQQPPLQPDPELEAVKEEIENLKEQRRRLYDILQTAASLPPPVPEFDWSKSPFYSHTLRSYKFDYPVDQMGFYITTLTSITLVSKALWRSWNIKKAAEMLEKGVGSEIPEMLSFHRHFSGLNNEQLKHSRMIRQAVKLKAFAIAGLLMTGFTVFVQIKNENRFNK